MTNCTIRIRVKMFIIAMDCAKRLLRQHDIHAENRLYLGAPFRVRCEHHASTMRAQDQSAKSSTTGSCQASIAESGLGIYRLTSFGAYCESLTASTTVQRLQPAQRATDRAE